MEIRMVAGISPIPVDGEVKTTTLVPTFSCLVQPAG
jgi:hypothetical protein